MINLIAPAATRRATRLGRLVADAVRSVVNPAALVQAQAATVAPAVEAAPVTEPVAAPEPTGLYAADDMPPVADIERAALSYDLASDNARRADRAKRKARKLLDRLPAGTYGQWLVRRVTSNRQTVDLEAVRATYKRLGLGPVPMRDTAPSLRVERIETAPAADEAATLTAVAA